MKIAYYLLCTFENGHRITLEDRDTLKDALQAQWEYACDTIIIAITEEEQEIELT